MQIFRKFIFKFSILVVFLFVLVFISLPDQNLHIVVCDVGQGDAILVQKGTSQILIDGGPDNKVLNCLARYMPFWDRKIDILLLTHPESDHYQGLINVIKRFEVKFFVANAVENPAFSYQELKKKYCFKKYKCF